MKKNKKKVDIILPNFNSAPFIEKTINSIITQTYKNWKLIIVDDFSNHRTKTILKKFSKHKKIRIIWLKKNYGAGYCRNLAIRKSNSPFIAFIDSDDIWKKNKLDKQVSFMIKNNFSFTYTNYETFGIKTRKVKNPSKLDFFKFIKNTSIATSTMMVRRDKIKNIKFTNSKICEDYYFKCKLLRRVKFAYCLNQYYTKYRIRKNSLQSKNFRNLYWIWKINNDFNKLDLFSNFSSLINISLNSLRKYGLKNII